MARHDDDYMFRINWPVVGLTAAGLLVLYAAIWVLGGWYHGLY